MPDYQAQSNKDQKAKTEGEKPEKHVEKLVDGVIVVQKKSLGEKFMETFFDKKFFSQMIQHVYKDVIIPNGKNIAFDAGKELLGQWIFRNGNPRAVLDPRTIMQRFSYNAPVNRQPGSVMSTPYSVLTSATPMSMASQIPMHQLPPAQMGRPVGDKFIVKVSTQEQADLAMAALIDIIESHNVASVFDLHEVLGAPNDPQYNNWGWFNLDGAQVTTVRDGVQILLPQALPLN